MPNSMGVPNRPGAIVMLRMPLRARSRAMGSVMPTTPPLDALYAAWPICPSKAATDAVEISTPRSPVASGAFLHMASAARRIMLKLPTRFTMTVRLNTLKAWAPFLPTVFSAGAMPAQLTRPISLPIDTALATATWPSVSLLTSQRTKAPPISLAIASPRSVCMSAITTVPPCEASMRAVPSPRPDAPPVTMNTLPLISMANPSERMIEVEADYRRGWLRAALAPPLRSGPMQFLPPLRRPGAAPARRWRGLAAACAVAGLMLAGCATRPPAVPPAPTIHPVPAPEAVPFAIAPQPAVAMRPPRIGLVLGGGAARGFAHVGVIQVLEEAGIKPDLVV